jgi:hypothetical protein
MSQRVYLHVGVPKSGTTFLQASLSSNRKDLRAAGVLYPGGEERMFLAAVDVRGSHKAWGRKRSEVEGAWDHVCRKARKHDGVTVISHELLGGASTRQVTEALTMLKGVEVHLVVTARDPARQATAEWQEGIKHGRRLTVEQFRTRVLSSSSETDYARRYRASQDLPDVLARWGATLPASRVHVVCCPPPDADPGLLWQRFAGVVGFDPEAFPPAGPESANPSLGTTEIDLLRRVNVALDKRLVQPEYGQVVKQLYAQELLETGRSPRPVVPLAMHDDLRVVGERWAKEIDTAGYAVHGDLASLVPVAPVEPGPHPDDVPARAQVDSAVAATAELLLEVQRGRGELARLEADNARLRTKRKLLKRRLRATTAERA